MSHADAEPSLPGVRHRQVRVASDVTLHVAEAGPEDGPLLVLLHGFPEFWYGWRRQMPFFAAQGYRVLAPDQRGYNTSDRPRSLGAYRLDRLSEDVVALIDDASRETASVVGHDWGASVAWWTAVRFPERLGRLGILNVPHPLVMRHHLRTNAAQRRRSWYIFFIQLPWLPELWFSRQGFAEATRALAKTSRPGTFSEEDLVAYRGAWRKSGFTGPFNWYRAAFRRPPAPVRDPRVRVPTLVIWGVRDRFLGIEMLEPSLSMCSDARAERLDATHWVQHEEADRVNELLAAFVSRDRP